MAAVDVRRTRRISFHTPLATIHTDDSRCERVPVSELANIAETPTAEDMTEEDSPVKTNSKLKEEMQKRSTLKEEMQYGIRWDVMAMKKSFKTVTILTVILATYLLSGAVMFWYIEECYTLSHPTKQHLWFDMPAETHDSYRRVCESMNDSDVMLKWMRQMNSTFVDNTLQFRYDDTSSDDVTSKDSIRHCIWMMSYVVKRRPDRPCHLTSFKYVRWVHFTAASCFTIGE